MKLGQDCYNGSAYADGHPLAYGGFDGRGLINKTPLDPLTSYSGGPHGPNHWAVRHSGASRRYCLGGRLYLGAAWSIEEMSSISRHWRNRDAPLDTDRLPRRDQTGLFAASSAVTRPLP